MAKRFKVNKRRSARKFRSQVSKTQRVNVSAPPRGGYRL